MVSQLKVSANVKMMKWESISSKNPDSAYSFKDDQNGTRSIFVSQINSGKRCFWCLREIQNTMLRTNNSFYDRGIGIPIERTKDGFICEGTFCTHNKLACALSWILRENNDKPVNCRDPIFYNSISLLNSMYKELYGEDNKIEPALDYRLLIDNGGSLTSSDFDKYKGKNINSQNQNMVFARTLSYKAKDKNKYEFDTHNVDIIDCNVEYISSLQIFS